MAKQRPLKMMHLCHLPLKIMMKNKKIKGDAPPPEDAHVAGCSVVHETPIQRPA
jgi:hypothetical protein